MVITRKINLETNPRENKYHITVVNVTPQTQKLVAETHITNGIVTLFVPGSTVAVTTIEFEPGLIYDFQDMWERLVPKDMMYKHEFRWDENNGYSHIRASMLGPSIVIPVAGSRLILGEYQQIIFVDFDNRRRSRQIILQIMGE